jgi:protein-S-isoprenylcysteine O-methyltransferase Ste14
LPDAGTYRRVLIPLVAGGIAVWAALHYAIGPHGATRWLGLALAIIGLIGVIVSRWTLGTAFSITPEARQLVARGIYSRVRNPIYVSGAILIAGLILIMRMPWLWLALVVVVVAQVFRARQEARVLEAKFGDEYRRYREQTWF